MKTQPVSITERLLFRLAQAVLPEATLLALFGRRIRVELTPAAADIRRRAMARR